MKSPDPWQRFVRSITLSGQAPNPEWPEAHRRVVNRGDQDETWWIQPATLPTMHRTTSDDGQLRAFRSGAFRAAARSGRPIVPIVIRGTRAMCPPDTYWLSNVEVTVDLLPSMEARDASRDAVNELRASAVVAIQQRIDPV